MNTRSPARQARAHDRATARETLLVLLNRVDRLSPTEAALLREYVHAELAEADQLTRARRGLDRARDRMQRRVDAAEAAMVEAEQDRDQARADYLNACTTIAVMHAAATGRTGEGPARGVVEDVADVRTRADRHHAAWRSARRRAQVYDTIISTSDDRANRAEQRAGRVEAVLRSVRDARTWVDVWTRLGMYYGFTPEQAGQEARARRTVDERIADDRAEKADAVTAETKRLMDRRTKTLRERAERAEKRLTAVEAERNRERKYAIKASQRLWEHRRRLDTLLVDVRSATAALGTRPAHEVAEHLTALLDLQQPAKTKPSAWLTKGTRDLSIPPQEPTP
ncbi:hypothetical protein OG357_23030 [Streptomyces sp. NBC_01255]|uniref:hypothetical protein n=1 Tax=Streptomyces sp. NBC_01255 TaxID=2903798 RepID=UPI002E370A17|nr:hypothetical protein [Streptomyces sp. NBC_01255]